ncbi:MAG: oligosaccharide flippase family protein, partial [Gemmatimonadota bacterium]|nr:oligosaccharide flippase family protein [Gemmatimonadota bacterium]
MNGAQGSVLASAWERARSPAAQTFVTDLVALGLGLLTSVQLARWLGPEGRGELAAAMLWPMMLVYLSSVGQKEATIYFSARKGSDLRPVFGAVSLFAAVQSVLAVGVGYLLLPWLLSQQGPDVVQTSRTFLWVVPASLLSMYGMSMLQARLHFRAYNALRLVIPSGYAAAVAMLHLAGSLTTTTAVMVQLALNVVVLGGTLALLRVLRVVGFPRWDRELAGQMLGYGAKVHAGDVSQVANLRLDQALLAAWFPPAQLGLYVAAASAASVASLLSTSVRTVLTPRIAQNGGGGGGVRMLQHTFRRYWQLS